MYCRCIRWLLLSIILLIEFQEFEVCGEPLSRADQCKTMRRTKVFGRIWMDWQPYYDAMQPCVLVCYVKQISHYAAHGPVSDGTPCFPGSSDVCFGGKCQQRSCDTKENVEDQCRRCGGNNLECQLIKQQFYQPFDSELYSYHHLTVIPIGATNINITEFGTKNYIALRTNNSEGLNQHFKLDPPGLYAISECTVSYQRTLGNHKLAESIYILGPVNQPINLEILTQQSNKGVSVSYWINAQIDPSKLLEANRKDTSYSKVVSTYDVRVQPKSDILGQAERNNTFGRIVSKYLVRVKPTSNYNDANLKEVKSKSDTWIRIVKAFRIYVKPKLTAEKINPMSYTYEKDYHKKKQEVYEARSEIMSEAASLQNSVIIPTDLSRDSQYIVKRTEINNTYGEENVDTYVTGELNPRFNTSVLRPVPIKEKCSRCPRTKLNESAYCNAAFVGRITPLSREVKGSEVAYDTEINFIYRVMPGLELTTREYIYISSAEHNSQCTCPHLTVDKEYIVMGDYTLDGNIFKLSLHTNSYTQTYKFSPAYQFSLLQNNAQCN